MRLIINIPKASVAALAVAISNHAHGFGVSAREMRQGLRPNELREKYTIETLNAWDRNRAALLSAKEQIKKQAGIE